MRQRRNLLLGIGAATLVGPGVGRAQPATPKARVCWVSLSAAALKEPYTVAFVKRLAELGFVEGRDVILDRRHGDLRLERMPAVAAELGKLKCDVGFGGGSEISLETLTQASPDLPIVFIAVDFDPLVTGDIASLARPGGRITGVTALQAQLPAKRLELLKELLPKMSKVAVLANEQTNAQLLPVQGTARRLGIALHVVDLKRPPFDFNAGFADIARANADALFVLGSGLWVPFRKQIPELALKAKLPTVFHQAQWVEAGGLMSYGFNFSAMWRRGAEMVADILRGAKPGNIPMEQPKVYELALNRKTAKTLGIQIPRSLLVRADQVIE
jgi:putative ABC transport system substrate-binding protein